MPQAGHIVIYATNLCNAMQQNNAHIQYNLQYHFQILNIFNSTSDLPSSFVHAIFIYSLSLICNNQYIREMK